jgi:hypothetical protein
MKFLNELLHSNISFDHVQRTYQFKTSVLSYLRDEPRSGVNKNGYWIQLSHHCNDEELATIRTRIAARNTLDKTVQLQLFDAIEWEMKYCWRDFKKYYYDFRTYGLSKSQAFQKSQTVCLLNVIKNHWELYHPELIYRALKQRRRQGEINCISGREFYRHVKWFMRTGISRAVLMGKVQWSK